MRYCIIPASIFLLSIVIGYHSTLRAIPEIMMKEAYERLNRITPKNTFSAPRMITADNQTIVRSSPDLAYSLCLIDVTEAGHFRVGGGYTEGYGSLTIFDMNTDAVFISDLSETDANDQSIMVGFKGIYLKDGKGIALIRRYAPTPAAFEAAKLAARGDICEPFFDDSE